MTAWLESDSSGYDAGQTRESGKGLNINPLPVNTYRAEIEEFSLAILEKREPYNNIMLGLESQKLMSACYESARTGKVVNID